MADDLGDHAVDLWRALGRTRLAEECRYLVRRPTEIFLGEGENLPSSSEGPERDTEDSLSQEELLKQPVHITHRAIKDPREIRLLDPACGSMHFGLYAFDLFEVIYEEAWDKGHCPALQEAYSKKADYLRDVNPRGTVPAIDDEGVVLWESHAIMIYLAEKHGWRDLWPEDLQHRARVNQYLHFHHRNTRELVINWSRTLWPSVFGKEDPDDGWRALRTVRDKGYLHADLYLPAVESCSCGDPERERDTSLNGDLKLPKLFSTYMRLGAQVISEPAIDRDFGTVDFLVLMDAHEVTLSQLDVVK